MIPTRKVNSVAVFWMTDQTLRNTFKLNINYEGKKIETSDLAKFVGINVNCNSKWTS